MCVLVCFKLRKGAPRMVLGAKMGVMGICVFHLSLDLPAKYYVTTGCRQIGHLVLDTQVQVDNAQMQQRQALVLTGRHAYYTRVWEAGALDG